MKRGANGHLRAVRRLMPFLSRPTVYKQNRDINFSKFFVFFRVFATIFQKYFLEWGVLRGKPMKN